VRVSASSNGQSIFLSDTIHTRTFLFRIAVDGYIKLYRELLEKPIWLNSTPEQKTILIALLLMANHKSKSWEWKGEKFNVLPGQFVTSLNSIKKICGKGISGQNIRTCLNRFKKLQFLTNKSTKMGRVITIMNWDSYQPKNKKLTKILTDGSQRPNKDLTPNKNERMKECNKKKDIYTPNFLTLWKAYPKKEGKAKAFEAYNKIKEPKPSLEYFLKSIEIHQQQEQWQTKKYIPQPAAWINQRRWEDEFDPINNKSKPETQKDIDKEIKEALA